MNTYEVKIREYVPILTGNEDRMYCDIRPSGLIGSLRWHAEWLYYCLGFMPCCNKATDNGLTRETETGNCSDLDNMCPICILFGSTAKACSFMLSTSHPTFPDIQSNQNDKGRNRKPEQIDLSFLLTGIQSKSVFVPTTLSFLLNFVQKYAAIGAGLSQGYGCFSITSSELPVSAIPVHDTEKLRNCFIGADITLNLLNLPSNPDYRAYSSQIVRKGLRRLMQDSALERHGFFGTFKDNWTAGIMGDKGPKDSVLKVSNLWKEDDCWKMRIWGYADAKQCEQAHEVIKVIRDRSKLACLLSTKLGVPAEKIDICPYPEKFADILEGM
jgi:CRISPR type III-B/RAMP module RAMP protein Cmr1